MLYRRLALARRDVEALLKAVCTSLERGSRDEASFEGAKAVDMVRLTSIMILILKAMRTEYAYQAGQHGAGYPQIGAAAGISRQAARKQWPGAVAAEHPGGGKCPLAQYLERAIGIPQTPCSSRTHSDYTLDHTIAPAAVHLAGCDAHIGQYQTILTDDALREVDEGERLAEQYVREAQEVEQFLRAAAQHGDPVACRELAWLVESRGGRARDWLHLAAGQGDQGAAYELAMSLTVEGKAQQDPYKLEQATRIWKSYAALGDYTALGEYAQLGSPQQAAEHWRAAAEAGEEHALRGYLTAMAAAGRLAQAAPVVQAAYNRWGRERRSRERIDTLHLFVDLLTENGRTQEAETWLRELALGGDHTAARELAWRLERAGDSHQAQQWLRYVLDFPDTDTTARTTRAGRKSRTSATQQALDDLLQRQNPAAHDAPSVRS